MIARGCRVDIEDFADPEDPNLAELLLQRDRESFISGPLERAVPWIILAGAIFAFLNWLKG